MKQSKKNKKKTIRDMRVSSRNNEDGTTSSHKMAWVGDQSKKRGAFGVFPTITPKKGHESSSDPAHWRTQNPQEAEEKGEMIKVKSRRKAEKLAAGSWKQGRDKKEAMKEYRKEKRAKKKS
jgi:hypothetical protein